MCMTRVPTLLGPVVPGTAAVLDVANEDRTANPLEAVLLRLPDKGTCRGLPPPLSLSEIAPL